jgi:asparagine synthase (glutamine-hydrolysing)
VLDIYAIAGPLAEPVGAKRTHFKECHRRDLYMRIDGDEAVDAFFFDDPDFTLICRADLLGSEPLINTAAYLGRLYREQGDRFVVGLRGAFAVILYDHNQRTLKAWVDHFGIEQLVFTEVDHSFAIATSIRSLSVAHRREPKINLAAILDYLQYTCIPGPKTIYEGISKLQPGHQLKSRPAATTRSYWDIAYYEGHARRPESVWADETRSAVRSAVASSFKNVDGPQKLGCFLSGGTDSSSVAGFVGRLTAQPPRTFSIGFDDARYNEIQYARIAAKHFSADHHEYFVKADDIPMVVRNAAQIYDEPFGNSSIVPTYHCARLAVEHGVTHLLAGDGGDELFGGNARYADDRVFQRYRRVPRWLRHGVLEPTVSCATRCTNIPLLNSAASYVRRSNVPAPDRYFSYSLISSVPCRDLFTPDFIAAVAGHDSLSTARDHFNGAAAQSELNRWLYLDLKITIADNDLRKVTMMSQLAGVTPRFPFLDPTLAEFTGRIPPELKVRGPRLRYIFKKAMQDLLPHEIIVKSKHGFGLPYSVWLADSRPLRDFTFDVLNAARCRQRGYFRTGLLDWLWSQYESVHRGYYGEILWMLLMLELWHVAHADARSGEECQRTAAISHFN